MGKECAKVYEMMWDSGRTNLEFAPLHMVSCMGRRAPWDVDIPLAVRWEIDDDISFTVVVTRE